MRLPVQAIAVKALLNSWDPNYRCFTFRNINMTPTLKEYKRIFDFLNNSHKIYLKWRIKDTVYEVVKLLCLEKINQYKVTNGGFKRKTIEAIIKKNVENGKLGDEWYKLVAFTISGLNLFPSENGVINL